MSDRIVKPESNKSSVLSENTVRKQDIIPAIVSPAKRDGQMICPDLEAFEKYLNFLYKNGIRKVIVQGSTGEGVCMPVVWANEFIQKACEFAQEQDEAFDVCVGLASPNKQDLYERIMSAKKYSIAGFMVIPPITTKPRREDVVQAISLISEWAQLPLIIYNNPARFIFNIDIELYDILLDIDHVAGIKECASPDSRLWSDLRALIDKKGKYIKLYSGDDDAWEYLATKGIVDGCVSVVGNIVPEIAVKLSHNFEPKLLQAWTAMCAIFSLAPTPVNVKTILEHLEIMESETFYCMVKATDTRKEDLIKLYTDTISKI